MVETNKKIYERSMRLFCTLLIVGLMGVPFGEMPPKAHANTKEVQLQITGQELLAGVQLPETAKSGVKGKYVLRDKKGNLLSDLFKKKNKNKIAYYKEVGPKVFYYDKQDQVKYVLTKNGVLISFKDKKKDRSYPLNKFAREVPNELMFFLNQDKDFFYRIKGNFLIVHDLAIFDLFDNGSLKIAYKTGKSKHDTTDLASIYLMEVTKGKDKDNHDFNIALPNRF